MNTPTVIHPRAEDVEGQPILRPLPSAKCRSVGPFVFFRPYALIDQARARWAAGDWPKVPGETERIELPVGRAAPTPLQHLWCQLYRHREQARSHIGFVLYTNYVFDIDQVWARACSR